MSVSWQSQLRWQSIKRPRGAREHWCIPVCAYVYGDLGNRPMGGLVGGRVRRISNSVQHSYWSLDTNNGRAKEDLVCVRTPSSSPAVLQCHWEVDGIEGQAAPFWGGPVHLEDWPACLSRASPPPLYKRQRRTWTTYGRDELRDRA